MGAGFKKCSIIASQWALFSPLPVYGERSEPECNEGFG